MLTSTRLVAAAAITCLALPGQTVDQRPDFEPVRQHITAVMADRNLMSASVAVAQGGEILWADAFGWADRETARRATPDTPYSLASISKPVTATALLSLVEAERLDLDAPLNRYLGDAELTGLAGSADEATVRRVLTHTAGLPLHYQFFYEDRPGRAPPMVETIARYGILVTPPGREYEYSNVGFGILGHAIDQVSGEALAAVLRARVFDALGMTQSALGRRTDFAPAAALRYDADHEPIPYYTTDHPAASEVYASARDLARFGMFHLGHDGDIEHPPIGRDTRRLMQEGATPVGVEPAYAMGWFVADEFGFRKIYHTGSMPGVSTMLALYPEHDVVAVALLNTLDRDQRVEIARELAAAVIPGYRDAWEEDRTQVTSGRRGEGGRAGRGRGNAAGVDAGRWTGTLRTWRERLPFEVVVEAGGGVRVHVGDQDEATAEGVRVTLDGLAARFEADLGTPDLARAGRYRVSLDLRRDGRRLYGPVTASSIGEPTLFALTSFVDLIRAER